MFSAFLRITRAAEWWPYKIPPLLAVGYALILVRGGGRTAVGTLLWAILALSLVGTFSYVVNDATDVDEDVRRGKQNAMAGWPRSQTAVLCIGLVLAAWGGARAAGAGAVAQAVFGVEMLLPVLYSVRPVRLKERGVSGVVADAAMVHVVPTLWIGLILSAGNQGSERATLVLGAAAVWAAGLGLRGILLHQLVVRGTSQAPLSTLGASRPVNRLRTIVLHRLLPMEWIALTTFVVALVPIAPLLLPAGVLIILVEGLRRRAGWRIPQFRSASDGEQRYLPLIFNEAYEVWIPLALVVQLAAKDPTLTVLAVLHVAAFLPNIRTCAAAVSRLLGELRRPRSTA